MEYTKFLKQLRNKGETILFGEEMKTHCSFGVGGKAKYFVIANSAKTLESIVKRTNNFYIIGNGTNIVFPNKYNGTIIKLGSNFSKIKVSGNKVVAGASTNLFLLNRALREKGLAGLEFTFGIPGSVGGAVIMNAGAFGDEIGNYVSKVKVFDGKKTYWTKDFDFSYRTSSLKKENLVVLFVEFSLAKGKKKNIEAKQKEFFNKRKQTQPHGEKSAGSVFKRCFINGETVFPAKIIDKLGLKGAKIGDAQVSTKHAGFIVNNGSAKQSDIIKLIKIVKNKVKKETDIDLEEEIIILKGNTKWLS